MQQLTMDLKTYVMVEFKSKAEVAVVHKNWIVVGDHNTKCKWPQVSPSAIRLHRMVVGEMKAAAEWDCHDIEILYQSGKYI